MIYIPLDSPSNELLNKLKIAQIQSLEAEIFRFKNFKMKLCINKNKKRWKKENKITFKLQAKNLKKNFNQKKDKEITSQRKI